MPRKSKHEVADLIHSASIHVLRRAGEVDPASGLTRARLSALSVVVFRGPLTLGALAEAEAVRPATMTNIVTGLEHAGFVRRRANAADGRSVLVEATFSGTHVLEEARARRIEAIAERLSDLGTTDLAVIERAGQLLEERFALHP
jgi:DNA-binding MarR family transcriptional regulator